MEHEITEFLNTFGDEAKNKDWGDGEWTKRIKDGICSIGKSKRYWVYASQAQEADGGEWLFDLSWLNYSNKDLITVELALECEWDRNGIDDDFQKLLLCRAEYKVMIFQANNIDQFNVTIDKLIHQIIRFTRSQDGDRYLFSSWLNDKKRFEHKLYKYGK